MLEVEPILGLSFSLSFGLNCALKHSDDDTILDTNISAFRLKVTMRNDYNQANRWLISICHLPEMKSF